MPSQPSLLEVGAISRGRSGCSLHASRWGRCEGLEQARGLCPWGKPRVLRMSNPRATRGYLAGLVAALGRGAGSREMAV